MSQLGPRLSAIARHVLAGSPVADLCCDHAALAIALVTSKRVPRAIAGDLNLAPLRAAAATIEQLGLGDRVELRQGSGLQVVTPGEVGTAVIAGIGAPLAERLLTEAEAAGALAGLSRLIIQPNHGYPKLGSLRAQIDALGWAIVDESLTRDRGRLYVILVAEPGPPTLHDEVDRELGPILRRADDPLFGEWVEHERARLTRACHGMQRGRGDPSQLGSYQRMLTILD
ncbi:tRNA (adenine(22)-N(1))-methyltransferase [Enhygromyxa salina]|uniref:tRNA (Adenine(22)-N(1))-methyltransferase n=1 Tax=Enhygromyxa salina TaxID=215803 RepID=A0A2S9XTR7_9BACT|nr:class I SAM-dependent methyltransferase [Enhygromyxa salina]PRP96120.1 tRNA (adenine(22)-N(1))-methyltransferase [Enhygromyxa salina]